MAGCELLRLKECCSVLSRWFLPWTWYICKKCDELLKPLEICEKVHRRHYCKVIKMFLEDFVGEIFNSLTSSKTSMNANFVYALSFSISITKSLLRFVFVSLKIVPHHFSVQAVFFFTWVVLFYWSQLIWLP